MLRWTVAKFGAYLTIELDGVTRNLVNMGMGVGVPGMPGMPMGFSTGMPTAYPGNTQANTFNAFSPAQVIPPPLPYNPLAK